MPSNEEVTENIKRTQNHTNKIVQLQTDTATSKDKEINIEGIVLSLQNFCNDISSSVAKLSGSVDELRKLVDLKIGGVK